VPALGEKRVDAGLEFRAVVHHLVDCDLSATNGVAYGGCMITRSLICAIHRTKSDLASLHSAA
jgi:hypothetical protein